MKRAITTTFLDTRTALAMSYAADIRGPSVPCSLRQALVSMMQTRKLNSARTRDWYARLISQPSRAVNFANLTPMERAAQCALIRQAVQKLLDRSHASAVMVAYALTTDDRELGIKGLVWHMQVRTVHGCEMDEVAYALIERRYRTTRTRDGFSLRDISARTGVSKSELARIAQDIGRECTTLEAEAMAVLERHFILRGVCEPNPVIDLS